MNDADSTDYVKLLRDIADRWDNDGYYSRADELRSIADLLDAVPADPVNLCAARDWKHVCHLLQGHRGPHACNAPGTPYGCDFTWPNENEITPCPSTTVAVLGMVGEPAVVRCGLLEGHDGVHRMSVAWSTRQPPAAPTDFDQFVHEPVAARKTAAELATADNYGDDDVPN